MAYISFFLFFIYLFLEIESFTPVGRLAHSSVLVGSKLYFFGGAIHSCSNEVFYLDVSQPFNIASPPWNDLTANAGMPIKNCWGSASSSEVNNEQSIYLFGGIIQDITTNKDAFTSLVYKFNLNSGRWEIPVIKGTVPERRRNIRAVSNNSGKIYIFSGHNDFKLGKTLNYFNDMVTFDIGELSWSISFPFNAPTPRALYSATLLSNGVIVYIGGYRSVEMMDISEINLYDTNSLTWSIKTAKFIAPIESREGHTAILASDDKIIIQGGSKRIVGITNAQVTPDIAVLNTETFEWSVPIVSSNIGNVPSLMAHTANLVGNYMIAAFGNITQPDTQPLSKNPNIYIMDIRNYTWVNSFEPENIVKSTASTPISPATSAKTTNPSDNSSDVNNQLTTMKLVIGILGATFGTATFMIIGFFGYKWYQRRTRKRQNEILRIPGNNNNI